jgi:hypothetical protein
VNRPPHDDVIRYPFLAYLLLSCLCYPLTVEILQILRRHIFLADKHKPNLPLPYMGLDMFIFVILFQTYLVTQSLFTDTAYGTGT